MSAKEYLQQFSTLSIRIDELTEELLNWRTKAEKITSSSEGLRVKGTPTQSRLEENVCKIIDIEETISEKISKMVNLRLEIESILEEISVAEYQTILQLRYINLKKWESIAERMNYSQQWVFILHSKALDEVEQIINKTVDCN